MGNTIKITKSKSFTYKKLNFLYLIFLVFMFFSNTGEYLRHYPALLNTQTQLNDRLIEKINTYNGSFSEKLELQKLAINYIAGIDEFKKSYSEYKKIKKLDSKRLYDHDFISSQFRFKEMGRRFTDQSLKFKTDFQRITKKDLSSDFESVIDEFGNSFKLESFYFQDLPNVAFETVMEHFKSLALYNSILYLFDDEFSVSRAKLVATNQAKFLQKLKSQYSLGENIEFFVKSDNSEIVPSVKFNSRIIIPRKIDSSTYRYTVVPGEAGKFTVEVISNQKRVLTSVNVSQPEFQIETAKSTFDGMVGEKLIIQLDKDTKLPVGSKLTCSYADVSYQNGQITVIPTKSGRISVLLNYQGEIVDELFVYAHEPKQIEVSLQDISGNNSNITQAYRLESTNTFWQVVGFRMTVVDLNGNKQSLRSATRFLRNELKLLEAKATVGSTIVFDEIRVIGKEKGLTNTGKPIIFVK